MLVRTIATASKRAHAVSSIEPVALEAVAAGWRYVARDVVSNTRSASGRSRSELGLGCSRRRRRRRRRRLRPSTSSGRRAGSAASRRRRAPSARKGSTLLADAQLAFAGDRRFFTHCVMPRGATRYCVPSIVSRFTGVLRHSPLVRPRTRSSRDPQTLMPSFVRPLHRGVEHVVGVNHPGSSSAPALRRAMPCWSLRVPRSHPESPRHVGCPLAGGGRQMAENDVLPAVPRCRSSTTGPNGSSPPLASSPNETGSAAFTVAQVAARAGLSLKSFYRCFPGKDDLLVALLAEESADRRRDPARPGHRRSSDPLHAFVDELFAMATLPDGAGYAGVLVREHRRLVEHRPRRDPRRARAAHRCHRRAHHDARDPHARRARRCSACCSTASTTSCSAASTTSREYADYLYGFCAHGLEHGGR